MKKQIKKPPFSEREIQWIIISGLLLLVADIWIVPWIFSILPDGSWQSVPLTITGFLVVIVSLLLIFGPASMNMEYEESHGDEETVDDDDSE